MPYPEEFLSLTLEEAAGYCRGSEFQRVRGVIATYIGRERSVLDFGCGSGIDAVRYGPLRYLGVDISRANVEAASLAHPRHLFEVVPVDEPLRGFGPKSFDCVIIKSVLEHLDTQERAVALVNDARRVAAQEVLVAWHTPPKAGLSAPSIWRTKGHFGRDITQNTYVREAFMDALEHATVEQVDNFELWRIRC